jgi:tRNA A37 threonylcarbamoyltransferase TsaD
MPYTVKGMDLSYSGLFTSAKNSLKNHTPEDVAYSFQEHAFAMLVEVTERAVAHTGKKEVLVVGGVAKNRRLISMLEIMCSERGARLKIVPDEFAGDNGAMIAYSGYLSAKKGFTIPPEKAEVFQKMRVDCDLRKLF